MRSAHPEEVRVRPDGLVPKERYLAPEFLDLEMQAVWSRVWQVACREEELSRPGDYVEYEIGDQSILVVRDGSGAVRAFHNACLHRGRRLARAAGCFSEQRIRCPYHGWCYELDGTVVDIPDRHEFLDLPDELTLGEVKADCYGGFVFVNLDPGAEPLLDYLDPIPKLLDPYRLDELRFRSYRTTVLPANWKTALDAFNEGYHVQGAHPQILPWTDDVSIAYEQFERHARYGRLEGARRELRPSPRLDVGEDEVDEGAILAALVEGLGGAFLDDERELVDELRSTPLPPGTSLLETYQERRSELLRSRGVDVSAFTKDQMTSAEDVYWFPNLVGPIYPGSAILFRLRPLGLDPERCLMDTWMLEWPRSGEDWTMPEREYVEHWTEHRWDRVTYQDYVNIGEVQAGMHSAGFAGLRLNPRQEANVLHMHRVIDDYLDS